MNYEKKCNRCENIKYVTEFNKSSQSKDGYRGYCRKCQSEFGKDYRLKNKESIKFKHFEYYTKNKTQILEKHKTNYHINIEQENKRSQQYYKKNRESVIERTKKYQKQKLNEDPIFKLKHSMRNRVRAIFKNKNFIKPTTTLKIIGCDLPTLVSYIESKFNNGMSWENQGKWHIDHIIPLSSARTEEEICKLCNYTNLQPLWAIDNLKKGSKLPS
jgi:hypothetical protein